MEKFNHKRWREKEGRLIHDGDCHFWGSDICTCGLIHHLMPQTDVLENCDWYLEQRARHEIQLERLPRPKPYVPPTEEQMAERMKMLEDIFGTGKFVSVNEQTWKTFNKLADEWENATGFMSGIRMKTKVESFQKLVDLGKDIIPLAFGRLKRKNGVFWYLVLMELIDNPPDCKVNGDMREMERRWLKWGEENVKR